MYAAYNTMSRVHFNFSKYKRIVSVNNKFSDIHRGERCFIVGTGPSLKHINPELLKDEVVFGVNLLYKGDFLNNITPKYYCLYDQVFHTTHLDLTKYIIELFPETTFFLRTKAYNNVNEFLRVKNENVYYQHCNLFQYGDFIDCNLATCMTAPFNVLLGCIQTAIYMGFSEIYLLGSDFNSFATLQLEHYYDKEGGIERTISLGFELKYYSMVAYHHYALQKYAESKGIKIVNLTPGSLLDAYPRESFEHVASKKIRC